MVDALQENNNCPRTPRPPSWATTCASADSRVFASKSPNDRVIRWDKFSLSHLLALPKTFLNFRTTAHPQPRRPPIRRLRPPLERTRPRTLWTARKRPRRSNLPVTAPSTLQELVLELTKESLNNRLHPAQIKL